MTTKKGHYLNMAFDDFGRFSDPALLILISLAEGAKHGYAMMEDIRQVSGAELGPGTLYGALARLEKQGWIAPLPIDDRRRPYQLTETGKETLRAYITSLSSVMNVGQVRLGET